MGGLRRVLVWGLELGEERVSEEGVGQDGEGKREDKGEGDEVEGLRRPLRD